ncbi:MAG: hypothetical protein Q8R12_03070 [bacterium]|nr:hypothetical protein [bacterium]
MNKGLFFDANPQFSNCGLLIGYEVLNNTTNLERLEKLEQFVFGAAKVHNDEACLELLKLLKRAYEFAAYDLAGTEIVELKPYEQERRARDLAEEKFQAKLMELYCNLPDRRKVSQTERRDTFCGEFKETLVGSKQWILKEIAPHWAEERNPKSIAAFRFLCEAYASKGRAIYPKERENILQIVQERTGGWFKPEHLEEWLKETDVPQEIRKKLVIARARNGGVELAERDIRNAELLKKLNPGIRSKAALKLFESDCEEIMELDEAISKLLTPMREYVADNEIELVLGYNYMASILIHLPGNCPKDVSEEIFRRSCEHIKKWQKNEGRRIELSFLVKGGKAELKLSQLFSKKF